MNSASEQQFDNVQIFRQLPDKKASQIVMTAEESTSPMHARVENHCKHQIYLRRRFPACFSCCTHLFTLTTCRTSRHVQSRFTYSMWLQQYRLTTSSHLNKT